MVLAVMKDNVSPAKPESSRGRKIRVVVVDDTAMGRSAITRLLASYPELCVTGQAEDGQAGFALADRLKPDLVVTDLQMPGLDGFKLADLLRKKHPSMRLVITSAHDGPTCNALSVLHGADAFVPKHRLPHELPHLLERLFPVNGSKATTKGGV
jgi:DNA-binding NarL/FixJ family response regulator